MKIRKKINFHSELLTLKSLFSVQMLAYIRQTNKSPKNPILSTARKIPTCTSVHDLSRKTSNKFKEGDLQFL